MKIWFRDRHNHPTILFTPIMPQHDPGQEGQDAVESAVATEANIDEVIVHPGTVRINVAGAFVTDEVSQVEAGSEHSEDIRLPHHTSIVSHVAIDVRISSPA